MSQIPVPANVLAPVYATRFTRALIRERLADEIEAAL